MSQLFITTANINLDPAQQLPLLVLEVLVICGSFRV